MQNAATQIESTAGGPQKPLSPSDMIAGAYGGFTEDEKAALASGLGLASSSAAPACPGLKILVPKPTVADAGLAMAAASQIGSPKGANAVAPPQVLALVAHQGAAVSPAGSNASGSARPTAPMTPMLGQMEKLDAVAEPTKPAVLNCNEFWCVKCLLIRSTEILQQRGNQQICTACVNAYSSIQNRWKKNRAIKTWWDANNYLQHASWYRKQIDHVYGQKRNFDQVSYQEKSSKQAVQKVLNHDNFIPWIQFLRRNIILGFAMPTTCSSNPNPSPLGGDLKGPVCACKPRH